MRIAILVEGKTEKAFKPFLIAYLENKFSGKMPTLDFLPYDGRLPTGEKLRRIVQRLLSGGSSPADAVIALTDVYTGLQPPLFATAQEAKDKMHAWVGDEPRFVAHVALHDFEAWLLPFWPRIQQLTGSNRKAPGSNPENVNHHRPPSHHLREVFRLGPKTKDYVKPRDAARILQNQDLAVARVACAELKAFLDTIGRLCGG